MSDKRAFDRPIRVIMFGSGPELNPDAKQFLCMLEEHPEIEFLGAFCQAESQSLGAVFMDLWKRRGSVGFTAVFDVAAQQGASIPSPSS